LSIPFMGTNATGAVADFPRHARWTVIPAPKRHASARLNGKENLRITFVRKALRRMVSRDAPVDA
jgi:hypothetical protein